MSECEDNTDHRPTVRLAGDLARLRELGVFCSAEFVVAASRPSGSSSRTDAQDCGDVQHAAGRFMANGGLLAGEGALADWINELREMLSHDGKHGDELAFQQLLEMWRIVEPNLLKAEAAELWPAMLRRLSQGREERITPSRGERRGGGI